MIINDRAELLFLYGRDIFFESIIEICNKLSRNQIVAILNRRNEFLGWGVSTSDITHSDLRKNRSEPAIRNLIDLGWYLRKGG